jgi:uncharacterized membrane protein YadS
MNAHDITGLVAIVGIFAFPLVGVVAYFACEAFKAWLDVSLKRDLIARGYTVQEIAAVIAINRESKLKELPDVPPAKPVKQPAYSP